MRSSHWEYVGLVLVGIGAASSISGAITFFYFQQQSGTSPQYSSYPLPLLIAGICIIATGVIALIQARKKKHREESESTAPLPPPPPPPPPPLR